MTSAVQYQQINYSSQLYQHEINDHAQVVDEYEQDIYQAMMEALEANKPNLELYQQQPYLTTSIRCKLIEFLIKMSIRLKILPFVVFKAIKIFDRYCSKRIILLDQSQLIITTCLWIAAKVQGGNNHFINLNNLEKLSNIKTINDLGYGSGGKYLGPTERFRLPKLHELIKLCGNKCKYDASMFKQMELHILSTLEWNFNDPSIEEFLISSNEFNILKQANDFFKIKEYLASVSLYSYELIDCNIRDLAKVMVDLINESFNLNPKYSYYQTINQPSMTNDDEDFFIEGECAPTESKHQLDFETYKFIKKNLIKAVLNTSDFLLSLFDSKGPQFLYNQIVITYKDPFQNMKGLTGVDSYPVTPTVGKSHNGSICSTVSTNTNSSNNSCFTYNNSSSMHSPLTPMSSISGQMNISPQTRTHNPAIPPQMPTPPTPTANYIYKPVPISNNTNSLLKKYTQHNRDSLPKLTVNPSHKFLSTANHQHNNSQASLNYSGSRETTDNYSIFELESRKLGVYTPMSDDESPILSHVKQFNGPQIPPHLQSQSQSQTQTHYKFV